MSKNKILLGLIAGIAVVFISGILVALDKSSVTGKRIRKKFRETAGNLKERFGRYDANVTRARP